MTMRLTGLASGMDTQSMVEAMLESERIPMYRLEVQIYEDEDRIKAWSDVDTAVSAARDKTSSLLSYLNWEQMVAESTSENVATVSAEYGAVDAEYDVTVHHLATRHRIGSDAQASTTTDLGFADGTTFEINGQTVTVNGGDTLQDLATSINTAFAGVESGKARALIIDTTLVLENVDTGSTELALVDTDGALEQLGVLTATAEVKNELVAAQDLSATVSGVDVTRSSNTGLEDVVTGMTLNFHAEGTSTVSVHRDTESIKAMITEFIDAYNSAMAKIEEKSKAEVGASGDDGVEAGILQGDSLLREVHMSARRLVTADGTGLDPDFDSLRKIGIWTSGQDNRLAIVDAEALDDALSNHLDEVEDLFRDYDGGVVRTLDEYLYAKTSPADGAIDRRQQVLQDRVDRAEKTIATMEERLTMYEESLYAQFAAMEEAIARMNSQTGFLSSLLNPSADSNS